MLKAQSLLPANLFLYFYLYVWSIETVLQIDFYCQENSGCDWQGK